ncbi:MAG: ribonuclease PH, partial [Atopobium sp.]|nr:ribonuclease PH [Atopobium sp.]
TGEGGPFDREQLNQLLDLGQAGIAHLVDLQNQVTGFRE